MVDWRQKSPKETIRNIVPASVIDIILIIILLCIMVVGVSYIFVVIPMNLISRMTSPLIHKNGKILGTYWVTKVNTSVLTTLEKSAFEIPEHDADAKILSTKRVLYSNNEVKQTVEKCSHEYLVGKGARLIFRDGIFFYCWDEVIHVVEKNPEYRDYITYSIMRWVPNTELISIGHGNSSVAYAELSPTDSTHRIDSKDVKYNARIEEDDLKEPKKEQDYVLDESIYETAKHNIGRVCEFVYDKSFSKIMNLTCNHEKAEVKEL